MTTRATGGARAEQGPALAEQLAAAGLDPLEVPEKARLYDDVLSAFRELATERPAHVGWVPGRLEVFGTHTDYAGGRTLVAAVPRGFAIAACRRPDGRIRATDARSGESMTVDPASPAPSSTGWRHYVEAVGNRLWRNFPGSQLGADVVFASDLPRAAGMSSSSALIVGVAAALVRLGGIRDRVEWQTHVAGTLGEAGYYACIENGRAFGGLAGDAGVGTHGGSEDHAAMLCAEPAAVSAFAFVPMRHVDTVRVPDAWRFVIASSGVAAEKTGAALESYNRLARGAASLLDLWNRNEVPAVSLAAALASGPSAASRLRALVRESSVEGWPADALDARLRHFIREDARIPEALKAFRGEDAAEVSAIAAASQADAEQLLCNHVDETIVLSRSAIEHGAFAARSFGAGFGGSVWALVERERAVDFVRSWLDDYRQRFRARARAVAFVAQPAPPVRELRL